MRHVSPSPMGIEHKNGFFQTWEGDQLGYRPVLHTHTHRRAHAHILCLSLINLRQVPTSYSSVIFLRLRAPLGTQNPTGIREFSVDKPTTRDSASGPISPSFGNPQPRVRPRLFPGRAHPTSRLRMPQPRPPPTLPDVMELAAASSSSSPSEHPCPSSFPIRVPPSLLLPTQARSAAIAGPPYLGACLREDCIASLSPCLRLGLAAPSPLHPNLHLSIQIHHGASTFLDL
jgi:hypothetical protein